MTEASIEHAIRLELGRDAPLWRNNVGEADHGWQHAVNAAIVYLRKGDAARALRALENPHLMYVPYGLAVGSSDLIGITPVIVTPAMVNRTVGVFTAIEVKGPRGIPTKPQLDFIELVRARGGRAGIARDVTEARAIRDT